jgi:hypothetical protein
MSQALAERNQKATIGGNILQRHVAIIIIAIRRRRPGGRGS